MVILDGLARVAAAAHGMTDASQRGEGEMSITAQPEASVVTSLYACLLSDGRSSKRIVLDGVATRRCARSSSGAGSR